MNIVITLPMPPMILSRIRKGPLIKYPYRLAYPTNIWDYGEYNKVSLFLQCSKMQIIPLKKIIIQTIFPFCQNGTFESVHEIKKKILAERLLLRPYESAIYKKYS